MLAGLAPSWERQTADWFAAPKQPVLVWAGVELSPAVVSAGWAWEARERVEPQPVWPAAPAVCLLVADWS